MKKIIITLLVVAAIAATSVNSYASDWDVAGKVFAGLAGLRILTGGNLDVIGNIVGIDKNDREYHNFKSHRRGKYKRKNYCSLKKVWVPRYVWKKKYIPEHTEYSQKYGKIVVDGHYIKYKVEKGGHWESDYDCG